MKNLKLMIIGVLLLCTSCTGLLDTYPEDFLSPEQYYDTEEQLNAALNGVYTTLGNNAIYGQHMQGRYGMEADLGFSDWGTDDGTVGDYNVVTTDAKVRDYWRNLYAGINRANLLLENIDGSGAEEEVKDIIKGEALFLRAYFYFMLTIRFGDVPLVLNTVPSPSAEALQVAQSTSKEVYEQILLDMEEASLLVRDVADIGGGGRVSKSAVWGMMARVCLYMAGNPLNETAKYEDVRKWTKMVMDVGHHELLPSFAQVFINYAQDAYDTRESIWEVEFWGNGTGLYGGAAGFVGIHNGIGNTEDQRYGFSRGILRATDWYYRVFDATDERRDFAIAPYRFSGNPAEILYWDDDQTYFRYCGKYRREYELVTPKDGANSPINYPLLRYADVLLMFAEADFHVNGSPTAEGLEAINQVRRRGYGVPIDTPDLAVDLEGSDPVVFISELKDERARELGYESLRKDDLIRWGEFLPRMKAVLLHLEGISRTSTTLQMAYKFYDNASARDVLWPIPASEISVNRLLIQNEGW